MGIYAVFRADARINTAALWLFRLLGAAHRDESA
jgi:hypothetical protein